MLLVAAAIALLLLGKGPGGVPPMDDTYIHLVYGHSLLSGSPLSYNGNQPSSGFTSPLWLPPATLASLSGKLAGPWIIMILSLAAAAVCMLLLPTLTGLLLLFTGPFFFHAASGMETSLACLAVVIVWRSIEKGRSSTTISIALAGSFLVRPELAVLVLPAVMALDEKSFGKIVRLVLPIAIAGAIWVLWNLHATGRPLPSTFYAKQAVTWPLAFAAGWKGLLKGLLLTSPLLFFASGSWITSALRRKGKHSPASRSLALVPLVLLTAALATQPNSYFQMRYYVPALTAFVLAAGKWLEELGRRRRLNAIILCMSMTPGLLIFAERRIQASIDVNCIDVAPAVFLEGAADRSETVAAADVGAVKWITGMQVLDLDGLVTPQRLPGDEMADWAWIYDRADFLIAFPGQYSSLIAQAGDQLEYIIGFASPGNVICGEDSVSLWRIR